MDIFLTLVKYSALGVFFGAGFALTKSVWDKVMYYKINEDLNDKILKLKYDIFIHNLESLQDKDLITLELVEIRKLEDEMKVPRRDFEEQLLKYEETKKLVDERGYL